MAINLPENFHHWVGAVVEKEEVGPHFSSAHMDGLGFIKKGFLVAYRPNKMGLGLKPNKPSSCSWVKPKPNLKTCLAHPIFAKGKVAVFGKHTLLPFSLALICPYFSI